MAAYRSRLLRRLRLIHRKSLVPSGVVRIAVVPGRVFSFGLLCGALACWPWTCLALAMNSLCCLQLFSSRFLTSFLVYVFGIVVIQGFGLLDPSLAQQPVKPLPRRGGCPSDYTSWGDYCVPGDQARGAIERIGSYCPSGFEIQGAFCLSFPGGSEAIPKIGYSCPPDWDSSGSYCLRR